MVTPARSVRIIVIRHSQDLRGKCTWRHVCSLGYWSTCPRKNLLLLTSLLSKVLSSVRGNTDMGQWPYYLNIADKLSVKIGNKNAKPQDYLKNPNKSKFNLKETTCSTVILHRKVGVSLLRTLAQQLHDHVRSLHKFLKNQCLKCHFERNKGWFFPM